MDLMLGGRVVNLNVTSGRSRRSVIAKVISEDEIELRLPRGFRESVDGFVIKHKGWLERAYNKFNSRKPIFSRDVVLYNGQYHKVDFSIGKENWAQPISGALFVRSKDATKVNDTIRNWLKQETKHFLESKRELFEQYRVSEIIVKQSRHRWGWCMPGRKLGFNSYLSALPTHLQEYLVSHELAHLFEANHSMRYKRVLSEIVPNHRELERELNGFRIH